MICKICNQLTSPDYQYNKFRCLGCQAIKEKEHWTKSNAKRQKVVKEKICRFCSISLTDENKQPNNRACINCFKSVARSYYRHNINDETRCRQKENSALYYAIHRQAILAKSKIARQQMKALKEKKLCELDCFKSQFVNYEIKQDA